MRTIWMRTIWKSLAKMRGSANYIELITDALTQNEDKKNTELQSQNWSWLKHLNTDYSGGV